VHERVILVAQRERVAVHHITVQYLNDRLALALDLEVDGALPLSAAHQMADRLEAAIRREFGRQAEIEIHIEPLEPGIVDVEEMPKDVRHRYITALEDAAKEIEGLS